MKNMKLKTLSIAVIAATASQMALALDSGWFDMVYATGVSAQLVGANTVSTDTVTSNSNVTIQGNSDGSAHNGGVFISSNGGTNGVSANAAALQLVTDGTADLWGKNTTISGSSATNINTGVDQGNVAIGNSDNTVTIQGATNNITGTTNINSSINANTSINTGSSAGSVAVGNNFNTTSLNSATNNIGVNAYATTNNLGNTNAATKVTSTAGNAVQSLINGTAKTTVTGGVSQLTARTGTANAATTSQVLLSNGSGATVDANGKISATGAAAAAPTVAVIQTNGYGNTHGMVIGESQTTLSGGANSTSFTLNDNGARFSNSANGAPVTVTGVADGRQDFDAVNYRQLKQVAAGVAGAVAMANIPQVDQSKTFAIGAGVGHFQDSTALALGASYRVAPATVLKASVSSIDNGNSRTSTYGVGAGFSW